MKKRSDELLDEAFVEVNVNSCVIPNYTEDNVMVP